MTLTLLLAALLPSAVIMRWFHTRDAEPEPRGALWKTFGWGVASIIPVLVVVRTYAGAVESITDPLMLGLAEAFLCAAVPEEFFKYVVVAGFATRLRDFDEPMDGIVYGVAASLGFATLENVLYVAEGGLVVALIRAVTAVPGHALYGAVMGVYVGRAVFEPARANRHMTLALFWPIVLHGLYDFPLLAAGAADEAGMPERGPGAWMLLVPLVLILSWVWVKSRVAELRAAQLAGGDAVATPVRPARPAGPPSPLMSRIRMIAGVVLTGGGALMALLVGVALLTGGVEEHERAEAALGTVMLAGPPLAVGLWLVVRERRRS